jgi:hypothetical protein
MCASYPLGLARGGHRTDDHSPFLLRPSPFLNQVVGGVLGSFHFLCHLLRIEVVSPTLNLIGSLTEPKRRIGRSLLSEQIYR